MSSTTFVRATGAERATTGQGSGRRLRRRHLWIVPGLAIAIVGNQIGNANGVTILMLIAFGIAPDLPRLFGSRGRPMHNLLHHPVGPVVAAAITATGVVPIVWLVASLVWLGHIVVGLGVGDVARSGGNRPNA
jgi:hypothetical protein